MFEFLMMVLMVLGTIAVFVLFALSICWAANQAESLKGEDDYPDARPMMKVTVLKQEVDHDDGDDNKNKR